MTLAIVGLGYVGLPLALQFARSGVRVLGLDVDTKKISALNAGRSYIKHIPASEIKGFVRSGKFLATTDFSEINRINFCRSRREEAQTKKELESPHVVSYKEKEIGRAHV